MIFNKLIFAPLLFGLASLVVSSTSALPPPLVVSPAPPLVASDAGCFGTLKPMRPLGCRNGYATCYCEDPYDWDTCRWIWICN